jgi:hypothetical protein
MTVHPIACPRRRPPQPATGRRRQSGPGRTVGGSLHARRGSRRLRQPAQSPDVRRDGNARLRPPRCSSGCPFVGRATTRSSSSAAEGKCSRRRPQRLGSSYLGAGRSRAAASKSPRGSTAGRSDPVTARVQRLATGQRSWRAAGPFRRSTRGFSLSAGRVPLAGRPAPQPSSQPHRYELCSGGGVNLRQRGDRMVLPLRRSILDDGRRDGKRPQRSFSVNRRRSRPFVARPADSSSSNGAVAAA